VKEHNVSRTARLLTRSTHSHCIVDYTLSLAMSDFCRTLFHITDVMNLMSVANVSMRRLHPCQRKKFIIYCDSRVHTQMKFIWSILSTIRQNGGIVLDMLEFCYF